MEARGGGTEICSVGEELRRIEGAVRETLSTLRRLDRLQGTVSAIGGGNPYRLVRCVPKSVLDPELTDTGFVAAVSRAVKDVDLLSRENGYVALAKALRSGCDDLRRKALKVADRAGAAAGSEGEASAAARLGERMKSALTALERKLAIALDGAFETRREILAEVAGADARLRGLWPDGSPALRTAALGKSASGRIAEIAANEGFFARGEFRGGKKRVRI